ncbi:hypothetical protein [Rhizobium sp. FKY42]|uniref:hypothetical protein n=1 Tax=Rhizobium sp. FKY42 TaxID=2562310 RepID=UPI0010BFAB60|nr:hypothetical protein [Rhizobium sp. FKY42]
MSERVACCVPFCRRTTKHDCSEWICGPHWMAVPSRLRRRKYRLFRLYKKRFGSNSFWVYPAGSSNRIMAVKLDRLCAKAWDRCKAAAIETAGGI